MTETERTARIELAAAFRLIALFGWDDHVATHMSCRLDDGSFLLNPFGLMFEEITAGCFLRMGLDGTVIENPGGWSLNPAAFNIHAGMLAARPDAMSVVHLHSRDGVAVSALKEGLLPLSQNALNIWADVACHEYEGVANEEDERARLAADIGAKHLMLLRNHGTLALGRSIAAAFYRIYTLEWACTAQVRTLAMGREITLPSQGVIGSMMQVQNPDWCNRFAEEQFFPAMLRKAARDCPGFDDL